MIIKVGCAEGRLGLVRRLRLEELTGSGGMESRQSSDVEGHTIVIEADAHTGVGSWYGLELCFGCMFSTDLGGRCRAGTMHWHQRCHGGWVALGVQIDSVDFKQEQFVEYT